jgi:hypothetical protein
MRLAKLNLQGKLLRDNEEVVGDDDVLLAVGHAMKAP